jgi:hypothetical protein
LLHIPGGACGQIAWKRDETKKRFDGNGRVIALRSLWIVLEKDAAGADAWMSAFHAALAKRDDAELRQKALDALSRQAVSNPEFAAVGTVAAALLVESSQIDRPALTDVIARGVVGDDLVVLTALAARRAGGDVWQTFRAETLSELGKQPLSGAAVVLLNRLSRPALPLVDSR